MSRPARIACAIAAATALVAFGFWLSGGEVSRGLGAVVTFGVWIYVVGIALACPLVWTDDEADDE